MDLAEKLERSRSSESIDFSTIACLHHPDRLIKVMPSDLILVEPVWDIPGDHEGQLYAQYRDAHPEYDGIYVRSAVLQRLEDAAKSFNGAHKLVLHAGHRPIGVQKQLLHDVMHAFQKHTGASDGDALTHARTYVSDPDVKLPPHCCGAAVDVTLFDTAANTYVGFGSLMNEGSSISHLYADGVSAQQKENRMLLLRAMLDAGFASYYAEWWHFSYGDQAWAWFYHKDACLYGLVEK